MDQWISARRADLLIVNKQKRRKKVNQPISELCRSDWAPDKTERKRKERPSLRTKKIWNMVSVMPVVDGTLNKYPQRIGKETGELRNKLTSGDLPRCSIVKISQNTEKCPGDLRRLAVTQTISPLRNKNEQFLTLTVSK